MDSRVYDFSKTTKDFRSALAEIADKSQKSETYQRYEKRNHTVFVDHSKTYNMTDRAFIFFVFAVIARFGRCFKDARDLPAAIQTAHQLFDTTKLESKIYFKERIYTIFGAERFFATHTREERHCHPVELSSIESRQAICIVACMLMVPEYMGAGSNVTNILHTHRAILSALSNQKVSGNWGSMSSLVSRVRDYFMSGSKDSDMLTMEHFAVFILRKVFSNDLEPRNWRQIQPSAVFENVRVSRTETMSDPQRISRVLGMNYVSPGTIGTIVRSMEVFDDPVVMFVFDVPWFMVHANFRSLVDDMPHKVIHCGSEYALAAVVASAETISTWRTRVAIVSGCLPLDSDAVYDIVDAFWGSSKSRSLLIERLWSSAVGEAVAPFGLTDQDSMHYQCFYCMMPVLVLLSGKEMAGAIAVDAPRVFDQEVAIELATEVQGDSNSLAVHRTSLLRLKKADASRIDMMYAMIMDPGLDIEWRKSLAVFLADSMVWPDGIVFEPTKKLVPWPISQRFDHVTEEVALATVNSIRGGSTKTMANIGKEKTTDVFYFPRSYNKDQDFVNLRTASLIDLAYAYHMFPADLIDEPYIIKATRPPSARLSLVCEQVEPMFATLMTGKDYTASDLSEEDREEFRRLQQQARFTPIMTPGALCSLPTFKAS